MLRNNPVPVSEKIFGVCALLYSSSAFIQLFMSADEYRGMADEVLASPVKRIVWPIIYMMALYFLAKQKWNMQLLKKMPLLTVLIGYVGITVLWSGSITASVLSVAALVGNTLVGFYFGIRYGIKEFLRLLSWVFGIAAVGAVFAPIVIGNQAFDGGFLIGFFAGKNSLGSILTIGFLVFTMLAKYIPDRERLYQGFAALCVLLVLLSGSATCILILFAFIVAIFFRYGVDKIIFSTKYRTLIFAAVLILSVVTIFSSWDGILELLGKGPDLTGRVSLWGMLLLMARDRPLLGYGYGGFWVFGGPAQMVWDALGVDPAYASYAHNGYLQFLLDCGLAGIGILFGLLFTSMRRAWGYAARTKEFWPIYFLVFIILNNLTESTLVARNNISWLLFVAVTVQLTKTQATERCRVDRARLAYHLGSEASSASV